jgi:hypothetical protein
MFSDDVTKQGKRAAYLSKGIGSGFAFAVPCGDQLGFELGHLGQTQLLTWLKRARPRDGSWQTQKVD